MGRQSWVTRQQQLIGPGPVHCAYHCRRLQIKSSDVKDKDWKMHKVATPLAFGVMATLANMDEVIALAGHKVTGAFDAAADNQGKGDLH